MRLSAKADQTSSFEDAKFSQRENFAPFCSSLVPPALAGFEKSLVDSSGQGAPAIIAYGRARIGVERRTPRWGVRASFRKPARAGGTPCPLGTKRPLDLLVWSALISLFCVSALGWSWGDSLASKNNEGNKLYKDGKIDEALSKWRDAQIENPDSDKLYYNIGNGLYEQKKYEDAFKEYEKSLNSKDGRLQQNAYYNIGNTHYRMGKLPEAIEDYKKCLDINPNDEDAKYNIEFIKKKLKEKPKEGEQKQKENQQKENKGEDQKQNQASQSQQGQQEEQKQEAAQKSEETKEKEDKQNQAQEQKKEEKPENQKPEEKPAGEEKKDEMSKEDAVRLLDALKDDEKDLQKELRTKPVEGRYKVEKDW